MSGLKEGQRIKSLSGKTIEIIEKLGEGGQGIVYRVKYDGQELALKWYFVNKLKDSDGFYDNIVANIRSGAPAESFLWPLEMTEKVEGSFGYLMKLRPKEYKDFPKILLAKERFSSVDAILNAGLSIINSFRKLHGKGLSYQDLNDGNFFVNTQTGDVLICDNDNVSPYGKSLGIAGKCRYMAPEVVTGKKNPDAHTDRFSLAVILYLLLFLNHPLEGANTLKAPCMTEEKEREFYGTNPIFVWDPTNDINRPVKGVHINEIRIWPVYPSFIQKMFIKAFSQESMIGDDIEYRFIEKQWQDGFVNLRGALIKCPICNKDTFVDSSKEKCNCINCNEAISNLMRLKVKTYEVILAPGQSLFECHTSMDSDDFTVSTAKVILNKLDPNKIGLRNEGNHTWTVILPNGDTRLKAPGEVVTLHKGIKIDFGRDTIGSIF